MTPVALLAAEFVGTFILIFAATAGPIVNQKYNGAESLIGNAACAGLAVMIVILSTGHISVAHLNPSLTIAFATLHPPLPVGPGARVYSGTGVCVHMCLLRSQRSLPPLHGRRRHHPFRRHCPGFRPRVPHYF
ncbi:unnamed protein product [Cuscuta campestris]|uniref:Aquaporin n=1 Tax=Cuscuta campestris TaxID=132261 RepID=A0A484L451_9ASTE|nr:unnamed protein product [Cuscuta campestris]